MPASSIPSVYRLIYTQRILLSNPSNRFYRLIIPNLLYSQYNHLERDHHEFEKGTMASLCPPPPTLPPFVHRQSKIKSIKFPAGKGERIVCWRTTSSLGNNKFVAPCESEVSLLLGHTLRIACTLKRRNNAAYKFRRHCGGFVPTEIDREFFYQRHIFQAMINFRRKILDFLSLMNLEKELFLKERKRKKRRRCKVEWQRSKA